MTEKERADLDGALDALDRIILAAVLAPRLEFEVNVDASQFEASVGNFQKLLREHLQNFMREKIREEMVRVAGSKKP